MKVELAVALIPLVPIFSATLLILFGSRLPKHFIAGMGAGSVAIAALLTLFLWIAVEDWSVPASVFLWQWMTVGAFGAGVSFYIDGLTMVMMSVITGVGFLIHLYSTEFMEDDDDYSRYFAYMNLFVGAMLILVMADNLLLLYLGWEGVGVCSYLLVGFWYKNPANGAAARKAFVVTRVGDTAMALGLFLLVRELGTLNIQAVADSAKMTFEMSGSMPVLICALLVGGAVGKSAQLPLQTWLPDAMAGPTPVSALIHAATMVTAGVYLIARTHELFLLAPEVLMAVALIGLFTSLLAAFSALNQSDIKRILAYSTISQIGYMFLALGVGAWSAGIFHLMTHAFFKALLFLAAGAVIHCLHHEHDIFKMGGLRTRLPVPFWSFLIGAAALAALPMTSGFFSKDQILLSAWSAHGSAGHWLWAGGLLGALITAIYSFRLIFVAFFGEANTEPDRQPGLRMSGPLTILIVLSILGGWIALPLGTVFPESGHGHPAFLVEAISIAVPIAGLVIAWLVYHRKLLSLQWLESPAGQRLRRFWLEGWGFDALYDALFVRPFKAVSRWLGPERIDWLYHGIVAINKQMHRILGETQTGRLRWYAASMVLGLIVVIAIGVGSGGAP
ncbi:MAG: NADH-quinone oxidoreductase subunit L [bacterium]